MTFITRMSLLTVLEAMVAADAKASACGSFLLRNPEKTIQYRGHELHIMVAFDAIAVTVDPLTDGSTARTFEGDGLDLIQLLGVIGLVDQLIDFLDEDYLAQPPTPEPTPEPELQLFITLEVDWTNQTVAIFDAQRQPLWLDARSRSRSTLRDFTPAELNSLTHGKAL